MNKEETKNTLLISLRNLFWKKCHTHKKKRKRKAQNEEGNNTQGEQEAAIVNLRRSQRLRRNPERFDY